MLMKCISHKWHGEVLVSDNIAPDGLIHFFCTTEAETPEEALAGVDYLFLMLTGGRETYIRARPGVNSEKNFDTKEWKHVGFARFSVVALEGKQIEAAEIARLPIGAA